MNLKQVIESSPDGFPVVDLPIEAVKDLQGLLNDCGYQLQADGIPGAKTQAAFESWKVAADQSNGKIVGAGSYKLLVDEAQERKNGLAPHDEPAEIRDRGKLITVPGISAQIGANDPVYNGSHFLWGELLHGMTRMPEHAGITENLIKLAKYLDEVRAYLGDRPMVINSGYRDPITNRRVGGSTASRHMAGDAADFWVKGMDLEDVFVKMKSFHKGRGGLAIGNGFCHIDLRGNDARWYYSGGPRLPLW